jgi:hypothetical protein
MKRLLTLFICALLSSAAAQSGQLTITPGATLEDRLTTVVGQRLEFRVRQDRRELQTATLNLTRAGRVVSEYALRRDGDTWVTNLTLELPYAYVATVRLYEQERVWASAVDLTVLEREDAAQVKPTSSASSPLNFVVTEGKPGNDANPLWGIAAMLVLVALVFFGTRGLRRAKTAPPTPKGGTP